MLHLIYHGSERLHNYFRSSGGANEEQKRKFGKVLWQTYKRMMKTAKGLVRHPSHLSHIWPLRLTPCTSPDDNARYEITGSSKSHA